MAASRSRVAASDPGGDSTRTPSARPTTRQAANSPSVSTPGPVAVVTVRRPEANNSASVRSPESSAAASAADRARERSARSWSTRASRAGIAAATSEADQAEPSDS